MKPAWQAPQLWSVPKHSLRFSLVQPPLGKPEQSVSHDTPRQSHFSTHVHSSMALMHDAPCPHIVLHIAYSAIWNPKISISDNAWYRTCRSRFRSMKNTVLADIQTVVCCGPRPVPPPHGYLTLHGLPRKAETNAYRGTERVQINLQFPQSLRAKSPSSLVAKEPTVALL